MNEVIKFLKENPVQYFATVGLDAFILNVYHDHRALR